MKRKSLLQKQQLLTVLIQPAAMATELLPTQMRGLSKRYKITPCQDWYQKLFLEAECKQNANCLQKAMANSMLWLAVVFYCSGRRTDWLTQRTVLLSNRLSAQRKYFFELIHKQGARATDHVELAVSSAPMLFFIYFL